MNEALKILLVGAGGSLGAISRYAIGSLVQTKAVDGFPWGTLTVNVVGCFLMGLLVGAGLNLNHRMFVFFGIGFLGSLTTFSAFSAEAIRHAGEGRYLIVATHIAANVGLSLLAAWIGLLVAKSIGLGTLPE